jgi:glycosyltransferase involved in cell wall biosynthesis
MRIAQVAPLFESVPPRLYGGTERILAYLTDELVRQGHDVTLFATGDSRTSARHVAVWPEALRLAGRPGESLAAHTLQLEALLSRIDDFDLVHFHTAYNHYPLVGRVVPACVTTLHGRLDLPEHRVVYDVFRRVPVVSISDAQRQPLPDAHWVATEPHGLPVGLLRPGRGDGGYLAFLGRVSPEKRLDRAIDIAERVRMPLRVAAKVDQADREYFEQRIRGRLRSRWVDWIGEIGERDKGDFLGGAAALLFPIDWPEPFGLVMIESLACGTPVIAWPHGSVPEVLEDGRTAWLVRTVEEAVRAVGAVGRLSRRVCRAEFERRFTAERMTQAYVDVYRRQLVRTAVEVS